MAQARYLGDTDSFIDDALAHVFMHRVVGDEARRGLRSRTLAGLAQYPIGLGIKVLIVVRDAGQ